MKTPRLRHKRLDHTHEAGGVVQAESGDKPGPAHLKVLPQASLLQLLSLPRRGEVLFDGEVEPDGHADAGLGDEALDDGACPLEVLAGEFLAADGLGAVGEDWMWISIGRGGPAPIAVIKVILHNSLRG